MKRPLALLALVVVAASLSGCLDGRMVGEPVPPFELVTNEGVRVNESTYLGRFLVLDLMATWCGPCVLEVEHLREVKRLHGDKVVILSVGADPSETTADLARFGREHGAEWQYAMDYDGNVGRTMGLRIIPKLVVVDPQGVVVLEREGEVLPAAIGAVIDPTVAAPEGGSALAWPALLALLAGLLAPFQPYRRLHRDSGRALPGLLAAGAALALAPLAWRFAPLVSTRATYTSLALGLLSLGALAWWLLRARARPAQKKEGNLALEAGDRLYEWAPAFALSLVLGLGGAGLLGFFLPPVAFALGAAASTLLRGRAPAAAHEGLGLAGLALCGVALLSFGARILLA